MTLTHWQTDGIELAYTDSGTDGETLLLIHGGGLADWFTPMASEPALKGYRVIRVVRAGYTSGPVRAGLTVNDHANHTAALLDHLGAIPAHVAAHSSGSTIALQLAADHPDLVRTLSLCEPPLIDPLTDPADHEFLRATLGPAIGSAMAATARGDLSTAYDTFMSLICGPHYRRAMTNALSTDIVEEAISRSAYFFTNETVALTQWTIDLAALRLPVLLVQGGESPLLMNRLIAYLAGQLPNPTVATVPDANHLMPLTHPAGVAKVIDDYVAGQK